MMVIVPRIAAVSYLDTMPFLYGIAHEGNFRAELSLSDFPTAVQNFTDRKADIALVPVHVVPTLSGARIVTGYCLGFSGLDAAGALLSGAPASPAAPLFGGTDAPLAALLGEKKPWAYAVWVAHEDADPDWIEALQYALTFGLEHSYEAVLEYGREYDPCDAYDRLAHIDYVFDNQKHKALEKFWDSGLKVAPRANPG